MLGAGSKEQGQCQRGQPSLARPHLGQDPHMHDMCTPGHIYSACMHDACVPVHVLLMCTWAQALMWACCTHSVGVCGGSRPGGQTAHPPPACVLVKFLPSVKSFPSVKFLPADPSR